MKQYKHIPFFLYLLPLFFYLFGVSAYGLFPSFSKLLLPFSVLCLLSMLIHHSFKKHRNANRIYIISFIAFSSYLFFGNFKDALPAFLSSYFILTPLLLLLPLLLHFLIRRKDALVRQLFLYLNILMLTLTILQTGLAFQNIRGAFQTYTSRISFSENTTSTKPSIYLILLDEYPGQLSLANYFQFTNDHFVNGLRNRGFYVFDTIQSNYDQTVSSINSTLNMQYLDIKKYQPFTSQLFYLKNYLSIRENSLLEFLSKQGYHIYNYSLFPFEGHNTPYSFPLLFTSNEILLRNTFHHRIKKDLFWKLCVGKYRIEKYYQKHVLHTHHQNNELINNTIALSKKQKQHEAFFVYTHLLMPHEPYFTDSTGKLYDMEKQHTNSDTSAIAFEYLKYTNKRMLALTDSIVQNNSKAIVILMSDHGYRDVDTSNKNLYCNNFMALYFPDKNYQQVATIKSNVNLFRVILNQYFQQQLPMLQDSSFSLNVEKNTYQLLSPYSSSK